MSNLPTYGLTFCVRSNTVRLFACFELVVVTFRVLSIGSTSEFHFTIGLRADNILWNNINSICRHFPGSFKVCWNNISICPVSTIGADISLSIACEAFFLLKELVSFTVQASGDVARMGGAGWTREARVADDSDFETLKTLLSSEDGWTLEYEKDGVKVWAEDAAHGALRTVKVVAEFEDVEAEALYDVLHDPEYRSVWDTHMLAAEDAGHINVNNDVGYYAMSCPAPLKNRDFVLQRSWLDTGNEKMILNHSVFHKDYPPRKGFVRALSLLTGFVVRRRKGPGSWLGYVSRSDPRGALPAWLVNRVTAQLAPRLVHQLHAASRRYPGWKALTDTPYYQPWRNPEQVPPYRISLEDCVDPDAPPPAAEPKPNTSKSKLEIPQVKEVESHSIEDLGDISSEFSVEVEELADLTVDPTKKKGKFYKLVKSMKNRRKSVQVAKSADNLTDGKSTEVEKPEKRKSSFKFHRRFSLNRGRED